MIQLVRLQTAFTPKVIANQVTRTVLTPLLASKAQTASQVNLAVLTGLINLYA
jgi:hypothetical protein